VDKIVIAYQSLNSNSSTEHGLPATTSQAHLRRAQRTLANKYPSGSGALKYPTNSDIEPHLALQGPAQLLPVADGDYMDVDRPQLKRKRSDSGDAGPSFKKAKPSDADGDHMDDERPQLKRNRSDSGDAGRHSKKANLRTLSMVDEKARQIYQIAYREFSVNCDLIVFGELDSTHPDWQTLPNSAGAQKLVSRQPKACNCFSVHGANFVATHFVSEGEGWCAARCQGILVVFVHVPNRLACKKEEATKFYSNIKNKLLNIPDGGIPDVFIGDTNQPRENFSQDVINIGMDVKDRYRDAHTGGIKVVDSWSARGVIHQGTNSTDTKIFDIAVYNQVTVRDIEAKYFTQLSYTNNQAAAYTDHAGVLVKVLKRRASL